MQKSLLGVLLLLVVACGPTPAANSGAQVAPPSGPKGKLVVAQTVDAQSMDPYLVNQIAGESVMKALFDHLIERDFDGQLVAGLAESWKVVNDTTLEFKLRKDVKFHNGETFDAAAVKFSIERIVNPELKSAFAGNFRTIQEVKIADPYTVQLILNKTDAAILDNLSAQLAIVPPQYVQQIGNAEFAKKPVGTGPFKFVEWVKDDHVTLEAYAGYWNGSFKGKPLVQQVTFRPIAEVATRIAELKTERIDLMQDLPADQVRSVSESGLNIIAKDAPQQQFIFFATTTPNTPLADKRVRQALNYGVDVDGIIKAVQGGYAKRIASPIGPLTMGFDANVKPYPHDPAKAKALLGEAGYANGFEVVIDATNTARSAPIEAVAGELAKIGVRATIRRLELGLFNDNWGKKTASPMIAASWSGMFDPSNALNFWGKSDGSLSRYKNPEVDKLIAEGVGTLDPQKRAATYAHLSKLLNDDPLALYLWANQNIYGVGKKVVGWKAHPRSYVMVSGVAVKE